MEKAVYKRLISFDFSQKAVLCSLLQWSGSVPRKDYPHMLVLEDGRTVGTVGGGAMEHQVINQARKLFNDQKSLFIDFDLTSEEPAGESGICGGKTKILIDPFTLSNQRFWKELDLLNLASDQDLIIHEVLVKDHLSVKRHYLTPETKLSLFPKDLRIVLEKTLLDRKPRSCEIGQVFFHVLPLTPPPVFHIFGAGHVSRAVGELAHFIDLDVFVYDDRADLASPERFPYAIKLVSQPFEELIDMVTIAPHDFILVATRGHQHDYEMLKWLLKQNFEYLGLISSRKKWKILSLALQKEGFTPEQISTVRAPVGLDLDSQTVPEIAVSIVSEVIYHYRKQQRSAISLSASQVQT